MTEGPILDVPGYVREKPQAPHAGSVIDSVPFSAPEEPPNERAPVLTTGLIDSVPAVSSPVVANGPQASLRTASEAPPITTLGGATTVQVPLSVPHAAPVAAPPTPLAPPTPPAAEHDPFVDWASDDVDVTRRAAPSRPTVRFTWDDGTVTSMTLPTLLGRNPAATAADLAVAIADTTLSLSKTHARVTVSPPAIEDLDSTNGVGIERNGNYVSVPRRQLTNLAAGDVVVLGNRRASVEVVS